FTVLVTPIGPGAGIPTGTVLFLDGDTPLGEGTLDETGQASFTVNTLDVGDHAITAIYASDDNFSGSSSDILVQTILPPFAPPPGGSAHPGEPGKTVNPAPDVLLMQESLLAAVALERRQLSPMAETLPRTIRETVLHTELDLVFAA